MIWVGRQKILILLVATCQGSEGSSLGYHSDGHPFWGQLTQQEGVSSSLVSLLLPLHSLLSLLCSYLSSLHFNSYCSSSL